MYYEVAITITNDEVKDFLTRVIDPYNGIDDEDLHLKVFKNKKGKQSTMFKVFFKEGDDRFDGFMANLGHEIALNFHFVISVVVMARC